MGLAPAAPGGRSQDQGQAGPPCRLALRPAPGSPLSLRTDDSAQTPGSRWPRNTPGRLERASLTLRLTLLHFSVFALIPPQLPLCPRMYSQSLMRETDGDADISRHGRTALTSNQGPPMTRPSSLLPTAHPGLPSGLSSNVTSLGWPVLTPIGGTRSPSGHPGQCVGSTRSHLGPSWLLPACVTRGLT